MKHPGPKQNTTELPPLTVTLKMARDLDALVKRFQRVRPHEQLSRAELTRLLLSQAIETARLSIKDEEEEFARRKAADSFREFTSSEPRSGIQHGGARKKKEPT